MKPSITEPVNLKVNESRLYHHKGCNNRITSKSCSITRKSNGYVWHCFKCGASGFYGSVGYSGVPTVQSKGGNQGTERSSSWPPAGSVALEHAPAQALEYLDRYFSGKDYSGDEIVYRDVSTGNPSDAGVSGRLSFKTALGYTERTIIGSGPKWKSSGVSGDFWIGGSGDLLVLTEDVISAMLVSEHASAIAVLGTTIHDSLIPRITRRGYEAAAIWFDDDSGIVKKRQLDACKKLGNYVPCTVIHTGTDPKNIPEQIPEVIRGIRDHFGMP